MRVRSAQARFDQKVRKHRGSGYRQRRSAVWCNRRGLPNKSESAVADLCIPGLECLVGTTRWVSLRYPGGRIHKRKYARHSWEQPPDESRHWRKHPDFAYGWEGPDQGGSPLLVVEIFGFGKYHSVPEAHYLKAEYARQGVLCLIFSHEICRREQEKVRRRIENAIAFVTVRQIAKPSFEPAREVISGLQWTG